jgi:hypothetical protein
VEAAAHIEGEWSSRLPDGREVVVRRHGEYWLVRCGRSPAQSENLDVALTRAIRADNASSAHSDEFDYPAWVRSLADRLDPNA